MTAKVKIAVYVAEDGSWCAAGASQWDDDQCIKEAFNNLQGCNMQVLTWVELDLPIPYPQTVKL